MTKLSKTSWLLGLLLACGWTGHAYADCSAENQELMQLQMDFNAAIEADQIKEAIEIGDKITAICSTSPALNYTIGMLYHRDGQDDKAREYVKKAIDNPDEFALSESNLETFWFSYYELSHENVFSKEDVERRDKAIEKKDAEINDLKTSLTTVTKNANAQIMANAESEKKKYETVMWTGVGVGGLGIAMAVVGGVLVHMNKDKIDLDDITFNCLDNDTLEKYMGSDYKGGRCPNGYTPNLSDPIKTFKHDDYKTPGFALIGAGIGLAVAGAAMAGFGGYFYTHPESTDVNLTDSVAFTWDVGMNNIQLGLKF